MSPRLQLWAAPALGALLAFSLAAPAAPSPRARPAPSPSAFDHQHLAWQRLLERIQSGGRVDYAALRRDPGPLEAYLASLARVEPGDYTAWTPAQREAFWLNAANAFTLKAVAERYPFKRPLLSLSARKFPEDSVRQDRDFGRELFTAAGQELTLEEARRLAVQLAPDPRLPLALTCPCRGGPPLPPRAFTADALDQQLDDAARAFLADPRRVRVLDDRLELVSVSEVLRRPEIADPIVLLRRYLPPDQAQAFEEPGWTVQWQPRDWTLDDAAPE